MPKHDYVRYFPFDRIRPEQRKAIEFALDAYESGKKAVLLEMGTGTGKSATGICISRYMEAHAPVIKDEEGMPLTGAYIITTQKILQEQYMDDFGPQSGKNLIRTIKSSSNYRCKHYADNSCAQSKQLLLKLGKQVAGTDFAKTCKNECTYSLEKQDFIESPISITNFSYFLAETTYAGKLTPRALLVVDECHNTETELGKFIEVSFSEKFARDVLKCKIPKLDTQEAVLDWVKTTYRKAVNKYVRELEKNLVKLSENIEGHNEFSKQYEMLEKHSGKIDQFVEIYDPSNWVMNVAYPQEGNRRGARKFEFKPIDLGPYSQKVFLKSGARLLMMSATVVDHEVFCKSIGLKPEEVAYLRIGSPFPVENRPIHYLPVGSMSKDNIEKTLPVMAEAVRMILEKHPGEKGMIHTTNYRIAKFLVDNIRTNRFLTHESGNRDEVLKFHVTSKEPTVLLSPSMMEGVDLADDASRFQILCKVPFPFLGDQVAVKRKSVRKSWYEMQTVKSILQSVGRSIRNEKDYAITYILDSSFDYLYKKNKWMFPEDFQESIQ
jgi:ATP-dependent DNA helicase DinG